ncbi:MAG: hypothetical protein K2X93_17885 [Candidatus Obscuribacterales bacterium]|nr:hypothetical protein [Candidatus Obscuribacterales bacterium]
MSMGGRERSVRALFFFACLIGAATSAQPAHALAAMEQGKVELKWKRYNAAKAQFMLEIQRNPSNQKAYLFLGRCLEYLKDTEDAKATYRACYSVNPFSLEGKQAKKFLLDVSGKMEEREHRAVDSPQDVIDSGVLIQRQSLELQARKIREARAYEQSRRGMSPRRGYYYSADGLYNDGQRRRGEVSNQDFINNSGGIYDAANEAAKARAFGQRQAMSIQGTANALIERLGRKSTGSAPALRAIGTNLYVQYYRSSNEEEDNMPLPQDPPMELRARQYRLGDPVPKSSKMVGVSPAARSARNSETVKSTIGPEDVASKALFDALTQPEAKPEDAVSSNIISAKESHIVRDRSGTTMVPPRSNP